MTEAPVVFDCQGDRLVGVLASPGRVAQLGVIIIVGGPQYRAGSHRQFVQLSRHLASQGIASLRFDVRGMGDSDGDQRSFEAIDDDIAAAIDTLQANLPSVHGIVLWGLCGGASAALLYAQRRQDSRIRGLALINPWVRSESTEAVTRVKHYYAQRLMTPEFWKKALIGGVGKRAVAEFVAKIGLAARTTLRRRGTSTSPPTLAGRMSDAWAALDGDILVVLSGKDYTAKEFIETTRLDRRWRSNLRLPKVSRLDVPEADHTFSHPGSQRIVDEATVHWMKKWSGDSSP
jgi:exosortase A-associated hydrolase 1